MGGIINNNIYKEVDSGGMNRKRFVLSVVNFNLYYYFWYERTYSEQSRCRSMISITQLYGKVTNIHFFRWFRIIVFEMSATCIFIYGVLSSQYLLPPSPLPDPYTPINNPIHSFFISCCLFLILCYSGQLTGGHCNPAVTLSLLITKGNKITPLVFVVYALSQFAGALLGGLIAWPLVSDFNFQ